MKTSIYNVIVDQTDDKYMLYNANKGSVCWILRSVYHDVFEMGQKSDFSDKLSELGFLVNDDVDEYKQVEEEKSLCMYTEKPSKMSFLISPTMNCNLNCRYCFEKEYQTNINMSKEDWEKSYEFIVRSINKNECCEEVTIEWFGGEPLLNYDNIVWFSKKMTSFCEKKDITYKSVMLTNGVMLDRERIEELKNVCKISLLQIPLDGLMDTYSYIKNCPQDTYTKVINNIEMCAGNINLQIRLNVSKKNCEEIIPLIDMLLIEKKLLGKVRIYLYPLINYNKDENSIYMTYEEFNEVDKMVTQHCIENELLPAFMHSLPPRRLLSCGSMQIMSCGIGSTGKLYRCEHDVDVPNREIGTIDDGVSNENISHKYYKNCQRNGCKLCWAYPICSGGCAHDNYYGIRDESFCEFTLKKLKREVILAVRYKQMKGGDNYGSCI